MLIKGIARILTVSVRNFGPKHLAKGLVKLTDLPGDLLNERILGDVLTDFLNESIGEDFVGSLSDWDSTFESLAFLLSNVPDCRIPLEMFQAAVRHNKTGDEKHLLSLPLEQRQLLEELLA